MALLRIAPVALALLASAAYGAVDALPPAEPEPALRWRPGPDLGGPLAAGSSVTDGGLVLDLRLEAVPGARVAWSDLAFLAHAGPGLLRVRVLADPPLLPEGVLEDAAMFHRADGTLAGTLDLRAPGASADLGPLAPGEGLRLAVALAVAEDGAPGPLPARAGLRLQGHPLGLAP